MELIAALVLPVFASVVVVWIASHLSNTRH